MAELCRLCGKHKCFIDMVIVIKDEFMETKLSCKDIIQHYCHVQLDSNELLPQSVCDECKASIQHFVSFCQVVKEVQIKLQNENEVKSDFKMKDCGGQLQNINDSINTSENMLNTSSNDNFFEMNQYELDSDFYEQLEERNSESKKLSSKRCRDVLVCL